jgi:hypothetical protein
MVRSFPTNEALRGAVSRRAASSDRSTHREPPLEHGMNPLIAIPTTSSVHAMTMASVFRTCTSFPGPIGFQSFVVEPMALARNAAVQHVLAGDWSHLMLVDPDIELTDDAVLRLLAMDVPIASGIYPLHLPGAGLCLSAAVESLPGRFQFVIDRPDAPTEADATGLGCCLIRRDVLEALQGPAFRVWVRDAEGDVLGEDLEFFTRVRSQLGIHPVIVPEVFCGRHHELDLRSLWVQLVEQARPVTVVSAADAEAVAESQPPAGTTPKSASRPGSMIELPGDAAAGLEEAAGLSLSIAGTPPLTHGPDIQTYDPDMQAIFAAVDAATSKARETAMSGGD